MAGLIPPGHQGGGARDPRRSAGAALQPDHRHGQADIAPGQHVHTHNLEFASFARDYAVGTGTQPTEYAWPSRPRSWASSGTRQGAGRDAQLPRRADPVNCSATAARAIADHFRRDVNPRALERLPERRRRGGADPWRGLRDGQRRRAAADPAPHAGRLCAPRQLRRRADGGPGLRDQPDRRPARPGRPASKARSLQTFSIQDSGGTKKTVAKGIELVEWMLEEANRVQRQPVPASHITVGPQVRRLGRLLRHQRQPGAGRGGGSAGAPRRHRHPQRIARGLRRRALPTRRAVSQAVADKLVARPEVVEDYTRATAARWTTTLGGQQGRRPGPPSREEEPGRAIAKSGTTNLVEVYEYAQAVTARAWSSWTRRATTPVRPGWRGGRRRNDLLHHRARLGLRLRASPSPQARHQHRAVLKQEDDIDLNCGEVVDGTASIDELGERIFRLMLETASGRHTKSELHGTARTSSCPGSWAR